jgi:hypothetical protein
MITFPTNPTLGQRYVAINGSTYTWMGNRWDSANALETGQALFYVEGGNAAFDYDENRDGLLDGGTA